MKKLHVKALLMAGIIAFSANVLADPVTTPTEEKKVELSNNGDDIINESTLKVPVTATLSNNEVVSDCRFYLGNSIQIGNNVTTSKPTGTVVIQSGASVTINVSGYTVLDKGTTIEKGAIFEAK